MSWLLSFMNMSFRLYTCVTHFAVTSIVKCLNVSLKRLNNRVLHKRIPSQKSGMLLMDDRRH